MKAYITGASRGLGCAIADLLTKQGFEVDRGTRGDIWNKWEGFKTDVLVNNAGVYGPIGPLIKNDWQEWAKTIDVNLLFAVRLCMVALPGMIKRGYGKIINISGGGATKARPNFSAYSTAKAALVRFTETLAGEVKVFHIDVNAVAPGMMRTALTEKVLAAGPEMAGVEEYRAAHDCTDTPERAAQLVAFLASCESDGITGRLISVHDPWEGLKASDFALNPDRYTLRRHV